MFWLKKMALIMFMTLGRLRQILAVHVQCGYPLWPLFLGQSHIRRRGVCEPLRCSSSAAASPSDGAREEDSWLTPETPTEAGREAFMFPPKPLPEGTVLRGMQESDVDSVVSL